MAMKMMFSFGSNEGEYRAVVGGHRSILGDAIFADGDGEILLSLRKFTVNPNSSFDLGFHRYGRNTIIGTAFLESGDTRKEMEEVRTYLRELLGREVPDFCYWTVR